MSKRIRYFVALMGLAVLATACGGDDASAPALQGANWEMTHVWDGTSLAAADPTVMVTATFFDGRVAGTTGCNNYGADYVLDADAVSFGDPSLTGAACIEGREPQADMFHDALFGSERYHQAGDGLEFTDTAGEVRVRFRAASELPLMGITWILEGYAGRAGGLVSPLDGSQITLAFLPDGTLTGIAGCNSYFADYTTGNGALTITGIAQTETACQEPAGVMDQERDYLDVLGRSGGFTTDLSHLRLLDDDGELLAELRFGGRTR